MVCKGVAVVYVGNKNNRCLGKLQYKTALVTSTMKEMTPEQVYKLLKVCLMRL